MCEPPPWFPSQANAIRLPSGENVGPDTPPGKLVKGTGLSGGSGGSSLGGAEEAADELSEGRFEYHQIPPPITSARRATAVGKTHCLHGCGGRAGDTAVAVLLMARTRPESR